MNDILNNSIYTLKFDDKIEKILLSNNMSVIRDLWKCNRKELKLLGLNDSQINDIIIKLELNGIGLNSKINT